MLILFLIMMVPYELRILILLLGIVGYVFNLVYWKRRKLPPGPIPRPIFGNMMTLQNKAPGYEAWIEWGREYGPIYTYWQGGKPIIVLTDYKLIKKTFIQDGAKYTGRLAINKLASNAGPGQYGILNTEGDLWSEHRKFALHVLKDIGLGKNIMEEKVQIEVRNLIKVASEEAKHGEVDLQDLIDSSVGSIINQLLFGYRFDDSNIAEFLDLKNRLAQHLANLASKKALMLRTFTFLKKIPFVNGFAKMAQENRGAMFKMFKRQIAEHLSNINFDDENSSDYVEAYLKKQKENKNLPDQGGYSEDQLLGMCYDLWAAGLETTSNTIYWGILYVLRDPEVQKKIHAEIDKIIANKDMIEASDRSKLHYVNAVAHEVQRLANLLPANLVHTTTEDVEIQGYKLPKGTAIVPQISAVLYDEQIFPNPYKFDPSRHLDSTGSFKKIEELIPFSIGKRACPGEGLARLELFLFLANFFKSFEIEPVNAFRLPSVNKRMGLTMKAENYKLRLKSRKQH